MPDLEQAISWCEDTLLYTHGVTESHVASSLRVQLSDMGFNGHLVKDLKQYLKRERIPAGSVLIQEGDEANALFFIEIGQVSVYINAEDKNDPEHLRDHGQYRVSTMQMGTIVGETGFYSGQTRTASVIADMDSLVYRLEREQFEFLKLERPDIAIALNELLVRVVSERLAQLNRRMVAMDR